MTTNQITLFQFGLGLTTTPTYNSQSPSFTGTPSVEIYKLSQEPAELSLDDMFAQLELSDPRAEAAKEVGTKWVAQTFLSNQPTTLSTLRMRAGLSQRKLAQRLKVSQPMIAKWEKEDTPNLQLTTIKNLADALSINIGELINVLIHNSEEGCDAH